MLALGKQGGTGVIFFVGGALDVVDVRDHEKGVLRKECGLLINGQTY